MAHLRTAWHSLAQLKLYFFLKLCQKIYSNLCQDVSIRIFWRQKLTQSVSKKIFSFLLYNSICAFLREKLKKKQKAQFQLCQKSWKKQFGAVYVKIEVLPNTFFSLKVCRNYAEVCQDVPKLCQDVPNCAKTVSRCTKLFLKLCWNCSKVYQTCIELSRNCTELCQNYVKLNETCTELCRVVETLCKTLSFWLRQMFWVIFLVTFSSQFFCNEFFFMIIYGVSSSCELSYLS